MIGRAFPILSSAVTVAVLVSAPAFAEGGFTSYMKDWLTGIETRGWDDSNADNASTTFAAKKCRYETGRSTKNIAMELNRNDTWTPDEHYGDRKVKCRKGSKFHRVGWGDRGEGNFDMTLKKIDGKVKSDGGKLTVKKVRIRY